MPKQHLTSNTKLIAFVLSWGVHRQIPVCDSFGDLSVLPFRPFACSPLNPGHFERNNKLMRAIAIAIHFSLVYLLCVLLIIIFIFGLFFYLLVSWTVISLPQGILILIIDKHLFFFSLRLDSFYRSLCALFCVHLMPIQGSTYKYERTFIQPHLHIRVLYISNESQLKISSNIHLIAC